MTEPQEPKPQEASKPPTAKDKPLPALDNTLQLSKVQRARRRQPTPHALPKQERPLGPDKPQQIETMVRRKPTAAMRIIKRLEKAKAQGTPAASSSEATTPTQEKTPLAIEEPKTYEVSLTQQEAQIWSALQQQSIGEAEVIEALLAQFDAEKQQRSQTLLDILYERQHLALEQWNNLRETSAFKITHRGTPPRTSQMDLALAQHIMEYKILQREDVQKMLRIQVSLHKWNIRKTLSEILIASKLLAADIVNPLAEQFRKDIIGKKEAGQIVEGARLEPLVCQRNKPLPLLPIGIGFVLCLVLYFAAFIQLAPQKKQPRSPSPVVTVRPSPKPKAPKERPPRTPRPPKQIITEEQKQKITAHQMQLHGLARWDELWIPIAYKRELEKNWRSGTRPRSLSFRFNHYIRYRQRRNRGALNIQGQFALPQLPKGPQLKMRLQVLHAFRQQNYARVDFVLDSQYKFRVLLAPIKPLSPGIYFIRVTLNPAIQDEFLRYFFRLTSSREWSVPFAIGSQSKIQEYLEAYNGRLQQQVQQARDCHRELQAMRHGNIQEIRRSWQSWFAMRLRELQQLAAYINSQQERYIPVYPATMRILPQVHQALTAIVNGWQVWHKDTLATVPALSQEYRQFAAVYDQLLLAIKREQNQLRQIIRTTTAKRAR